MFLIVSSYLALFSLILVTVYFQVSRDKGPVHRRLAASKLPRRFSVRELFANTNSVWGFEPSFDGQMLAWWGTRWGRLTIFVGKLEADGKLKVVSKLSGRVEHFTWLPYEAKLNVLIGNRLWLIDPFTAEKKHWIDVTPRGFQSWNIISKAGSAEGRHLIASFDRNPALSDLYAVRPDGGGKELVLQNEGRTQSWIIDFNNLPVARVDKANDDQRVYLFRDPIDAQWKEFARTSSQELLAVWQTSDPHTPMEALSNRGRDKVALVSINPYTGAEIVLLDDPNVDVLDVFQFCRGSRSDLAIIRDGYPRYVGLSPRGETFVRLLRIENDPVHLEILGFSQDGRFATVGVSRRERPIVYYLFDLSEESATRIAEDALGGHHEAFADTRPITFLARDGRPIPAFLTLPTIAASTNLPAIVMIHGGPAGHDVWKYDREKQFLSNRGYALLSVNYRGSTGYGKSFQAAGYGEFGRAMQDDIVDAAHWLVSEGVADETKIAVMGGSYGGYAAALAMTRDPGLFRAAIIEYGMLDVKYQMQNNPFAWGLYIDQITRYFGDPNKFDDLATMMERSPLLHVKNVTGDILITAGKEDTTVGFEQSEAFEKALKDAGKSVEAVYFEHEGHGYVRWQTKVVRARAVEKFLARTLGGRSQRFDITQILAAYWR